MNTIKINTVSTSNRKPAIGDIYTFAADEAFIVAQVNAIPKKDRTPTAHALYCLISLSGGNRWADPVILSKLDTSEFDYLGSNMIITLSHPNKA